MDTYQVKFCETTQETYDNLTNIQPGTLYFTTDTKRLYRGSELYASKLTPVYENGEKFTDWAITRDGTDVTSSVSAPVWVPEENAWEVGLVTGDEVSDPYVSADGDDDATMFAWEASGHQYVAQRSENKFLGYAIAGQTDKPLAPASLLPSASDDDLLARRIQERVGTIRGLTTSIQQRRQSSRLWLRPTTCRLTCFQSL